MDVDESSMAYKLYKDFVVPPFPPAFEHLNLPPYWIICIFEKSMKKRSNRWKSAGRVRLSFQELARDTASAYRRLDPTTKAWLDNVAGKLLSYNKAMCDTLWRYIKNKKAEEKAMEEETKKISLLRAAESAIGRDVLHNFMPAVSHGTLPLSYGAPNDIMREYLQRIQLQASMPHLGMSSYYPDKFIRLGELLTPAAQYRSSLASREEPPSLKRKQNEKGETSGAASIAEAKRARTDSQSSAPFTEMLARDMFVRQIQNTALYNSTMAPQWPVEANDNRMSWMASNNAASLGVGLLPSRELKESALRGDQIMLGYRLGLNAAARANARTPNQDITLGSLAQDKKS